MKKGVVSMGEFQKRIKIALDGLWGYEEGLEEEIMGDMDQLFDDAKKELGNTNWLEELKAYILKHSIKLTEETPIFSVRHFISKIDEHKEKLEKWFGKANAEQQKPSLKHHPQVSKTTPQTQPLPPT